MTTTEPVGFGLEIARAQPLMPMAPQDAAQVMRAYQDTCKAILTSDDRQRVGAREFTTRSGFQKLAAAYGVSTEITRLDVTGAGTDEDPMIARAVVRAVHPTGRHAEGDGACSSREKRFRKGDEKMDHSLPATAVTRAANRAVSNLVAFGTVSAEEAESTLDTGGPAAATPQPPGWAAPMTDIPGVAHNLVRVLEAMGVPDSGDRVQDIGQEIFNLCDGTFPFALARLAHLLAKAGEEKMMDEADRRIAEAEVADGETYENRDEGDGNAAERFHDEPTTTDGKDDA